MPTPPISRFTVTAPHTGASSLTPTGKPSETTSKQAEDLDGKNSAMEAKHYAGLGTPKSWLQPLIAAAGFKGPLHPAHLGDTPMEGHDIIAVAMSTHDKQYLHAKKQPGDLEVYKAEMLKNDGSIVSVSLRKSGQVYVPLQMEKDEDTENTEKFGMLGGRPSKEKAGHKKKNPETSSSGTEKASTDPSVDELAEAAASMSLVHEPEVGLITAETDRGWEKNRRNAVKNFQSYFNYVKDRDNCTYDEREDILFRISATTPHKDRATLYVVSNDMVIGLAELEKPSSKATKEKYKLPFARNLVSLPGSSMVGVRLYEARVNLSEEWKHGGRFNLSPLSREAYDFHYAMGARPTIDIDIDEHDFDDEEAGDILMHFDPAQHPDKWARDDSGSWYHIAFADRKIYSGLE